MPVLLFVQLYVVVPPVFAVEKDTETVLFSQTILLTGCSTCPFGLTVIINVTGGPGQTVGPLVNVGVLVIVADMGDVPGLVAVNEGKFPLLDAISPMPVLLFVHAYVVVPPVFTVVNVTGDVAAPVQTNISAGLFT